MDRFRNILVTMNPGQLDPDRLRGISGFASINDAEVTVLDVVDPLPSWRKVVNLEGRMIDVEEMLLEDRRGRIRSMLDVARLTAEVTVVTGKPLIEIIRLVVTRGPDLVVVGEPAPGPDSRRSGLSPGVMQLLRKCPVPVWVVRPSDDLTVRILALVDPDPTDAVRDGLNDQVLDLALAMCDRSDGELHVAHAWELAGESTLRTSAFLSVSGSEIDVAASMVQREHERRLAELVDRHRVEELGGQVHLVRGSPEEALPALAERLGINTIVMGTVARTGLPGLIMGNTAEAILREVNCSVLALKPPGFVSPVKIEPAMESEV